MVLVKLLTGQDFVYDGSFDIGQNFPELDVNKLYQVYYEFVELTEEQKKQLPENANVDNKQIQYSFKKLSDGPECYKNLRVNVSQITFFGDIEENSGLNMIVNQYKNYLEKGNSNEN